MNESYVAVSIVPVSRAALFGIKCPKFRDSVNVVRKVRTFHDKNKTITLSRKVGNQIPSDIGSHFKTDTSSKMLWQQTPGYRLFEGAEPTMVVIKLMWFGWTITLRIGEGHVAKYFQGDSFGMTDEKHEITHSVRFEVHTSVSINQVSGKPTVTSFMVENPLKLKAEAEGSSETSKITYPVIWLRILEDCM